MLVECGFVRAQVSDGREWTFRPSLARIASLGRPDEIVALFGELHAAGAERAAAFVLASLCDQEDATPLIGWRDEHGEHPGLMPGPEKVILARHLMRHGIVGKSKPGAPGGGAYSPRFEAAEYIAAARVHLGLSSADAAALSMTEFQTMLEMKFPEVAKKRDLPTRDEYIAAKARFKEMRGG